MPSTRRRMRHTTDSHIGGLWRAGGRWPVPRTTATPVTLAALTIAAIIASSGAPAAGVPVVGASILAADPAPGAPILAEPDAGSVVRGASVVVNVLGNDLGPGGAPLVAPVLTIVGAPTQGSAEVVDVDGVPALRYTPRLDAATADSLQYEVTDGGSWGSAQVSFTIANAVPVATEDTARVTSAPGTVANIDVLANDTDPDSGVLVVTEVDAPTLGTASITPNGQVAYDPIDGAAGLDTFTYTVTDGQGGAAVGTVRVDVTGWTAPTPEPPPPTPSAARTATAALPQSATLGNVLGIDVTTSGMDPTGATAQLVVGSAPALVATAPLDPAGAARLEWTVTQATAGLTPSRQAADLPVSVLVTAADGQQLSAATGTIRVTAEVEVRVSGPLTRADVPYSYRPGCPVRPESLRRMTLNYWNYSGQLQRGSLIVRADGAADLGAVFTRAFDGGFRIKRITPIETYYAKGRRSPTAADKAAMRAGNTSAFNCRSVVGNPFKRSAHSYGVAIDINTFENPYVTRSTVYPPRARKYLDRSPCRTGMICKGGVVATAMRARGWLWGARWSRPDYQHFSSTGG